MPDVESTERIVKEEHFIVMVHVGIRIQLFAHHLNSIRPVKQIIVQNLEYSLYC